MKNDVIKLLSEFENKDIDGYISKSETTEKLVYAECKSVTRTEFYSAMQAGVTAVVVFVINSLEYEGELKVEYKGKKYSVIRTYQANADDIELVCGDEDVKK